MTNRAERLITIAAILFFLLGQFPLLYAQVQGAVKQAYRQKLEEELAKAEEGLAQEIDYYIRYMPSRHVSAVPGEVAILDTSAEYSYDLKVTGRLPLEVSLKTQYIDIRETVSVPLPARLTGVSFGLETTLPFFSLDKTYLRLGVSPSFYTDDWNFNSSAWRMPLRCFIIYQPHSGLAFIMGAAVFPSAENKVLPVVGVIYQPNDKLSFNLVPERPTITYALNKRLSVFIAGDMTSKEFKLDYPGLKNTTLAYKETYAGSGIQYRFNKYSQASFSGGWVFNRTLKYHDSLGKVSIKDGLYSEFRLELSF